MKRMLVAGRGGNRSVVEEEFARGSALSPTDDEFQKILRYNYATCLFHLKDYDKAADLAFELAMEYFDVLGLRSRTFSRKTFLRSFQNSKSPRPIRRCQTLSGCSGLTRKRPAASGTRPS